MSYCPKCGKALTEGAQFCVNCGASISDITIPTENRRKQEFAGSVIKCPNCGEVLSSFTSSCPTCGHEIRGIKASESVRDFAVKLAEVGTEAQKAALVRNFPIPNTKEDVFEFMILASSNIESGNFVGDEIKDAWMAKFEQGYQKSKLLFEGSPDFERIQALYDKGKKTVAKEKKIVATKRTSGVLVANIAVFFGIIALIIAIFVDISDKNSSTSTLIQLIGGILLIISSCFLAKRHAPIIDYGITLLSGLIAIGLSFIFDNGSMVLLCGIIVMIITTVNYFKSMGKKKG